MSKIIVLDTETTCSNGERVVSISCVSFVDGKADVELNEIVYPNGWTISYASEAIHGISTTYAKAHGKQIGIVMKAFDTIIQGASLIVAHNVAYDSRVIRKDLERLDMKDTLTLFEKIPKYCTMKMGAPICNIVIPGKE